MEIPLLDAVDQEILMHRDVHFGGNFPIMIDYYKTESVGVMPDFEMIRIKELKKLQDELGEDLSMKVLPLPAVEEVNRAKELYKKFRDVYEQSDEIPRLVSDLILAEEGQPEKEIAALVGKGDLAVDPLIHIIDSADFYDPLFPGYGRAPGLAAMCLGKIGNPKAVYHLFLAVGKENFFVDEAIIQAIVAFGDAGKEFLFKRLMQKPINKDNENAAVILASYPLDEEIAKLSLHVLLDPETLQHEALSSYLICMCEGLKGETERKQFKSFSEKKVLTESLKNEALIVNRIWQSS